MLPAAYSCRRSVCAYKKKEEKKSWGHLIQDECFAWVKYRRLVAVSRRYSSGKENFYFGVAIDPTCINIGRLERTQPT